MVEPTRPLGPEAVKGTVGSAGTEGPGAAGGKSFSQFLADSIAEVNRLQQDADSAIVQLQTGQANLSQVMVAVEKADLAFKTLMQIRNKLVEAYKQIEQMRL